jgi:hypothetical protein
MKALADDVRTEAFKHGIYSSPGAKTTQAMKARSVGSNTTRALHPVGDGGGAADRGQRQRRDERSRAQRAHP